MASLKERMAAFQSAANQKEKPAITPKKPGKLNKAVITPQQAVKKDASKPKKLKKTSTPDATKPKKTVTPDTTAKSPSKASPTKKKKVSTKAASTDAANVVTPSPKKKTSKKAKSPSESKSSSKSSSSPKKSSIPKVPDIQTSKKNPEVKRQLDAISKRLEDKSNQEEVEKLLKQLDSVDGFPQVRPLTIRDNDIVQGMSKVVTNDPTVTQIVHDSDARFAHLSKSLLVDFAEALSSNFYVTKIVLKGGGLGNDFLSALAGSLQDNVSLRELDLSHNDFTNDGLTEFCQAVSTNTTLTKVNLTHQNSAIFETAYETVFAALTKNQRLGSFQVDFKTKDGSEQLKSILTRNQKGSPPPATKVDDKILSVLRAQVKRAQDSWQHRRAEEQVMKIKDDEWGYLYELSVLFDKYKLQEDEPAGKEQSKEKPKVNSTPLAAVLGGKGGPMHLGGFRADGSFLNDEFISQHLQEIKDKDALIFDFCGQGKLFKQFPPTDSARAVIVEKFVDALLHHPRAKEITGINMANCGLGNDFLEVFAERCLAQPSLPSLHMLNVETNFLTEPGIEAISKCLANPETFRYLQVVKLENQKSPLTSEAEYALARAMCVNRSVVVCSLRVRNLLEREQINKYVVRNIDFLRQARRRHAIDTGTLQARKRNDMEQLFDKIAANDASITEVNLVGNQRFIALKEDEKTKAGAAFANNSHVKTVLMSTLQLNDKFALALGKSLESNSTIEKLLLDSNAISGDGLKAIFSGLAQNTSISEMQVRHQSKKTASADEEVLPDILEPNQTITKLGVDLRNQLAKMKIDRKLNMNREYQRKLRAQRNKK